MIPNHPRPYGPEHCEFCRIYHADSRYRLRVDASYARAGVEFHPAADATYPAADASRHAAPAACRHLGDQVDERECDTCRGRVRLKVLACAVHGRCTVGKRIPGVAACCAGCPDHV